MDEKYLSDVKSLWKDQIAGIIDYDYSDFLGALADLQSDPSWKEAYQRIETDPGVSEFLERVQQHFDLCNSPFNEDGSVSPYQHPSRTKRQNTATDNSTMVALTKRHFDSIVTAAKDCGVEGAEQLSKLRVVWTNDLDAINDDSYARDGSPAEISLYGMQGDIHEQVSSIENAPRILSHLREACYGLAADYELQRYLMQSFYKHSYDVDSIYKLNWLHGCDLYFDETTCYVYDSDGYKAHKKTNQVTND